MLRAASAAALALILAQPACAGDQPPTADAQHGKVRIVTVADIFDALTATRPYKQVWTPAQALAELDRMADAGQLDRDCVAAVHSHLDQFLAIYHRYQDDKPDATPPLG